MFSLLLSVPPTCLSKLRSCLKSWIMLASRHHMNKSLIHSQSFKLSCLFWEKPCQFGVCLIKQFVLRFFNVDLQVLERTARESIEWLSSFAEYGSLHPVFVVLNLGSNKSFITSDACSLGISPVLGSNWWLVEKPIGRSINLHGSINRPTSCPAFLTAVIEIVSFGSIHFVVKCK